MAVLFLVVLLGMAMVLDAQLPKHAAYDLPDGTSHLSGTIRRTFTCSQDGYYADQDNNCQIFHVCHTVRFPDGSSEKLQWSFMCGEQTIFNQYTFTCSYPKHSIPCSEAHNYYYLNNALGNPAMPFLTKLVSLNIGSGHDWNTSGKPGGGNSQQVYHDHSTRSDPPKKYVLPQQSTEVLKPAGKLRGVQHSYVVGIHSTISNPPPRPRPTSA